MFGVQGFTVCSKRRPTKRAPDAGDSAQISSSFTRLFIFLAGRLRRPRPSAGNANRWAAGQEKQLYNRISINLDEYLDGRN